MLLAPFVSSLFNLSARLGQEGIRHEIKILGDSFISRLRNNFASALLHSDHTHLLMVDNDLQFQPEGILEMLVSGKQLIGMACCRKELNWERVSVGSHVGLPAEALKEVAGDVIGWSTDTLNICGKDAPDPIQVPAIGSGIMLAHRTVFETIRAAKPELEYTLPDCKDYPKYWDFFGPFIHPDKKVLLAEDYSFCQRAASVEIPSFLFTKYRTVHYGPHGFVFNRSARQEIDSRIALINNPQQTNQS